MTQLLLSLALSEPVFAPAAQAREVHQTTPKTVLQSNDLNSYAYFITIKEGRAETLTMFLDMGAFDDVWSHCTAAGFGRGRWQ